MGKILRIACGLFALMPVSAGVSQATDLGSAPEEPVFAAEPSVPVSAWSWDVGARYWYSTGESSYDLFDSTGSLLISRLTYEDLTAHSGETFFRGEHANGFFVKGYVGGGIVDSGDLVDEDFLPFINPFSQTISDQNDGSIRYGSVDIGHIFYDNTNTSFSYKDEPASFLGMKLGAFIGYHYLNEEYNAFGCTQLAANPFVCSPGQVAPDTLAITQDSDWSSLRIGLTGDFYLSNRLTLTGDVAYVRTALDATDTHHLRIGTPTFLNTAFNGPTPQDGSGQGVQVEAILSYQITDTFNLGIGARYWHMEIEDGLTHFEVSRAPIPALPQVTDFETERYGVFLQGSYKF